jgi:hypothetical protein
MKEADWLACTDPHRMLEFLRGKASSRKLRLFTVACCRHLQSAWPSPPEYDRFLEWAEMFADETPGSEDLTRIGEEVADYVDDYAPDWWTGIAQAIACAIRLPSADPFGIRQATVQVIRYDRFPGEDRSAQERAEFAYQASVLQDLIGPFPFRPQWALKLLAIDPAWLTPAMIALAQGIYEERAFDRLPKLADALEEAGCTNPDILGHCRCKGPHARGCWVVDLILNKE